MNRKQLLTGISASLGMLILILDGQTALSSAQDGIELCIKTVIPSLFPFFLLSILLTNSLAGTSVPFLTPLGRLCQIPTGTESILISGFLGGYPVGAQSISSAYHAGHLKKADAERMLAFCNNAGPAFIFGMVSALFPSPGFAWALWGIHMISAVLCAVLLPNKGTKAATTLSNVQISVPEALEKAIRIMAAVCGWIILFRVMIGFLQRWILWALPTDVQIVISGLLELSNGCHELQSISDLSMRFVICSCILAFGGFCVTMQTMSVTAGLSLRFYYLGKAMQTLFSLLLSISIFCHKAIILYIIVLFAIINWKKQKRSSFSKAVSV